MFREKCVEGNSKKKEGMSTDSALRRRIAELEEQLAQQKYEQETQCTVHNCEKEHCENSPYCWDHKCSNCSDRHNGVGDYCDDCACKDCRKMRISYNYSNYSKYCCGCGCKCGCHVKDCCCYT